ncbi:alpha/beta fold hydrolase [Sneathiella chungangensis]|uniref:Alpha/beta fold hydrolase n=1 Tax=Sneathiella chungangensis TaxID=1418234 RepID=A0A845MDQ5_9PROT|nr:alpha/beta fold hydrolase [Sneathiella chungangensis]MZR21801.1 alpha/beta fold hydrolase [Sneathiella chungangensis]
MKKTMILILLIAQFMILPVNTSIAKDERNLGLVILVHGLARSSNAMWLIGQRLEKAGYRTCAIDYPSMTESIENTQATISSEIERCIKSNNTAEIVHFVTHSLGGPLARDYLSSAPLKNMGRMVMLSPPNHGSDLVEHFGHWKYFRSVLGPIASELTADHSSWLAHLPVPNYEIGVLAGNYTFNPIAAYLLDGKDDGAVTIEDMKLEGMADFMEVSATHVTIRYSSIASRQISYFLNQGHFAD